MARYVREERIAERPRGGQNNVRVDEEIKECLSDLVKLHSDTVTNQPRVRPTSAK